MLNILQNTKEEHLNYTLQRYLGAAVVLIDIYSRTPSSQQSEPLPFKYKNVECKISTNSDYFNINQMIKRIDEVHSTGLE